MLVFTAARGDDSLPAPVTEMGTSGTYRWAKVRAWYLEPELCGYLNQSPDNAISGAIAVAHDEAIKKCGTQAVNFISSSVNYVRCENHVSHREVSVTAIFSCVD